MADNKTIADSFQIEDGTVVVSTEQKSAFDTNMKDIQDVLRYQSSSAGDGRMGLLQPATGFTPAGNMSLRGFPINSRLRNGLLRYNAYNLDNVERVEVIKGPAAVFFGNAFPGGVINYVTKQPSFSKLPTSIDYSYTSYDERMGGERATLDHNAVLSDSAALRVVGAWDHGVGNARYEFQNGYSVNAGLTQPETQGAQHQQQGQPGRKAQRQHAQGGRLEVDPEGGEPGGLDLGGGGGIW
jgi:outer membrane receptor protein involved in Fe transport